MLCLFQGWYILKILVTERNLSSCVIPKAGFNFNIHPMFGEKTKVFFQAKPCRKTPRKSHALRQVPKKY